MTQHHPIPRHGAPVRDGRWRERGGGSVVMFGLIALALLLAIGFFYVTKKDRGDSRADAVIEAADSADNAAQVVGAAARNAADALRNDR